MKRMVIILLLTLIHCKALAFGTEYAQLSSVPQTSQVPTGKYVGTMKRTGPNGHMIKIYDKSGHLQGMRDAHGNYYNAQGRFIGNVNK
jgi:hypothetical protein